jgi:hypothetical protein
MIAEDLLFGVFNVDGLTDIIHLVSGNTIGSFTLRNILLNYLKMQDDHPMIAEAHQVEISQPTYVIIPNTPEEEWMAGMTNKNLATFLWHMLLEQGLPEQFITDLIKKSCEACMVKHVHLGCGYKDSDYHQ